MGYRSGTMFICYLAGKTELLADKRYSSGGEGPGRMEETMGEGGGERERWGAARGGFRVVWGVRELVFLSFGQEKA